MCPVRDAGGAGARSDSRLASRATSFAGATAANRCSAGWPAAPNALGGSGAEALAGVGATAGTGAATGMLSVRRADATVGLDRSTSLLCSLWLVRMSIVVPIATTIVAAAVSVTPLNHRRRARPAAPPIGVT